jgi:hypothetical protein
VVDRIVAPLVGGNHSSIKAKQLVEFTSLEGDRHVGALAPSLVERDQYCGVFPILHSPRAIGHRTRPASAVRRKGRLSTAQLQDPATSNVGEDPHRERAFAAHVPAR